MSTSETLKSCPNPWCVSSSRPILIGTGLDEASRQWVISCGCGVVTFRRKTEAEAITAWNTRSGENQADLGETKVRNDAQFIAAARDFHNAGAERFQPGYSQYGDLLDVAERVLAFATETRTQPSSDALREALEPSADTKAAYSGEIKYSYINYDEFGDEQTVTRTLEWTTIKDVMAMIRARSLSTSDSSEQKDD